MDSTLQPARRRATLLKLGRGVFGLVGLAFITLALRSGAANLQSRGWPSWPKLLCAFVLLLIALTTVARGWASLFGGDIDRRLRRGFYLSLLGKYIPGGVWQLAGQVLLSAGSTFGARRIAEMVPLHLFVQFCTGVLLTAAWGLIASDRPPWMRIAAIMAGCLALLLRRPWLEKALAVAKRIRPLGRWTPPLPEQADILRSLAWTTATLVLSGTAFVLLLVAIQPFESTLQAVLAFSVAWTAGFIALPFPSGIGVREAALVWVLGLPPEVVVAASIAHRLVTIVGEVILSAIAALSPRQARKTD